MMLVLLLSLASSSLAVSPKPKVPSLSHSIVNLGKMDINVFLDKNGNKKALEELFQNNYHGDSHGHESPKSQYEIVQPSRFQPKTELVIEECPCNRQRSIPAQSGNPMDLLSKILMNHDLFSSHNDPASSSLCCTSHEQVQEEFIIEFGPKPFPVQSSQNQLRSPQPRAYFTQPQQPAQILPKVFPYLPFLFDSFQNKTANPKSKQIEILLLPTKKGVGKSDYKSKSALRSDIQAVGDKKTTMLYEIAEPKSSVKKDLNKVKVDIAVITESPKTDAPMNIPNNTV